MDRGYISKRCNIPSITRNEDEWDEIDFETDDVNYIFKMDNEDDDYSWYSNAALSKGSKIIMNIRWETLTIFTIEDQETIHKQIQESNFSSPFV